LLVSGLEGLVREWEQGQQLKEDSLTRIAQSMYPIESFLQGIEAPTTTVNALLGQQYLQRTQELAIITPETQLTYAELQAQVQVVSQLLRATYQVKPGDTVMVLTERSHWWLIAMLGVLDAGAVYLPADPSLPKDRLQHYVKETATQVALTHSAVNSALEGVSVIKVLLDKTPLPKESTHEPTLSPGSPAFLLFTSGSTGTPKAVQVSHGAFAAMITDQASAMGISETDRIQWFSSPLYDASLLQMLLPLVVGGTSIVVPPQVGEDLSAHRQYLTQHETTVAIMPPSYLHLMDITQVPSVKKIISGGESPVPSDLERYTQTMEYFNSYGATETTVCSSLYSAHEFSGHTTRIPIGTEVANTLILLLDDTLKPVPYGVIGQICVASPNLADGYPYDPALTQEKFIHHPLVPGVRVYCTGDLGVKRPDGHIEFVGRKDDQVKVRGRRIELAETEAALLKQPEVQQCVVVLHALEADQIQVAYITGTDDVAAVKAHAAQVLPAFQVPEVIIPLDVLPRTVQGKVDKQQLPPPFPEDSFGELEGLEMEGQDSQITEQLVSIWREIIQTQKFTHQDNFFDIGGTSLQIIKMFDAINLLYPDVLKVSELFDHPTLESQVQLLESKLENSLTDG
ncbi:MAG: non-ribosomal peptide synthetase, partial [Bacteroidota bacterium]